MSAGARIAFGHRLMRMLGVVVRFAAGAAADIRWSAIAVIPPAVPLAVLVLADINANRLHCCEREKSRLIRSKFCMITYAYVSRA